MLKTANEPAQGRKLMDQKDLTRLSVNTIRGLSMDAVQRANAGHPGTPMALAPLGYTIFMDFLEADPRNRSGPDRDRFMLSAGHASMLQYSLLHLTGYDLSIEDLKRFRQWGSRTPGHPERGHTAGRRGDDRARSARASPTRSGWRSPSGSWRSASTGPAEEIVDHHVYAICSDGDIMEGISQEAASIAGHSGSAS